MNGPISISNGNTMGNSGKTAARAAKKTREDVPEKVYAVAAAAGGNRCFRRNKPRVVL